MLEIACFEITSAETALRSVADRIEFCAEQQLGGITPNIEEFRYLKSVYRKPMYVMIRPKGGPFFYSEAEIKPIKTAKTDNHRSRRDHVRYPQRDVEAHEAGLHPVLHQRQAGAGEESQHRQQ